MKRNFFSGLNAADRYMIANLFFLYLIQGIYVILIGSILPMMREEYGLNYQISGFLLSAHNIGNVFAGLFAGLLPLAIGLKHSLLVLNSLTFIGFLIALLTGQPVFLIFAFLLTGLGRGAVSNYNNQAVSSLSGGSSAPLNALHGFFAIGAVLAPVLAMVCTNRGEHGWRYAVYVVLLLGVVSMISSPLMNMESVSYTRHDGQARSLGFLKERRFLHTLAMMFFYLCVEASVMGWILTYYTESGVLPPDTTQILTSILWIAILAGRFACSAAGSRFTPPRMIRVLSGGILLFLLLLLLGRNLPLLLIGTVGLGLSMSGMYGTTVANAGDVFSRYPLAMSVFVTGTSIGSSVTPAFVGWLAEVSSNIRWGFSILLFPALLLFLLAVLNRPVQEKSVADTDMAETGENS